MSQPPRKQVTVELDLPTRVSRIIIDHVSKSEKYNI